MSRAVIPRSLTRSGIVYTEEQSARESRGRTDFSVQSDPRSLLQRSLEGVEVAHSSVPPGFSIAFFSGVPPPFSSFSVSPRFRPPSKYSIRRDTTVNGKYRVSPAQRWREASINFQPGLVLVSSAGPALRPASFSVLAFYRNRGCLSRLDIVNGKKKGAMVYLVVNENGERVPRVDKNTLHTFIRERAANNLQPCALRSLNAINWRESSGVRGLGLPLKLSLVSKQSGELAIVARFVEISKISKDRQKHCTFSLRIRQRLHIARVFLEL